MLGLAIITSAISCFLTIFLFFRYALFMPWGVPAKAAALVIALGIGFSPILLHHSMENFLGKFYVLHYHFIYFVFVFALAFQEVKTDENFKKEPASKQMTRDEILKQKKIGYQIMNKEKEQ